MFWLGFFIGIATGTIPTFLFLLWALDRAYNLGYKDAQKEEEDISYVQDHD
jgi:lipoate-protein ligase A